MGWIETVPPAEEPVYLTEFTNWIRQDDADDNQLIGRLIVAARIHLETVTHRTFVKRTIEATFDEWPTRGGNQPSLILPVASPLLAIKKVRYVSDAGADTPLAPTVWEAVTNIVPGRLRLKLDQNWPDTSDQLDAITLTYETGYGGHDDVPELAKQGVFFLAAHWYEHREAVDIGERITVNQIPNGFDSLVWSLKVPKV